RRAQSKGAGAADLVRLDSRLETLPVDLPDTTIDLVGEGIYRFATFDPRYGISFNQFLIPDERPALIHTGPHYAYERVRKAVAEIVDPKKLAYVVVPHFESDECGGMGRFIGDAPEAQLVCSEVGAGINLSGWG